MASRENNNYMVNQLFTGQEDINSEDYRNNIHSGTSSDGSTSSSENSMSSSSSASSESSSNSISPTANTETITESLSELLIEEFPPHGTKVQKRFITDILFMTNLKTKARQDAVIEKEPDEERKASLRKALKIGAYVCDIIFEIKPVNKRSSNMYFFAISRDVYINLPKIAEHIMRKKYDAQSKNLRIGHYTVIQIDPFFENVFEKYNIWMHTGKIEIPKSMMKDFLICMAYLSQAHVTWAEREELGKQAGVKLGLHKETEEELNKFMEENGYDKDALLDFKELSEKLKGYDKPAIFFDTEVVKKYQLPEIVTCKGGKGRAEHARKDNHSDTSKSSTDSGNCSEVVSPTTGGIGARTGKISQLLHIQKSWRNDNNKQISPRQTTISPIGKENISPAEIRPLRKYNRSDMLSARNKVYRETNNRPRRRGTYRDHRQYPEYIYSHQMPMPQHDHMYHENVYYPHQHYNPYYVPYNQEIDNSKSSHSNTDGSKFGGMGDPIYIPEFVPAAKSGPVLSETGKSNKSTPNKNQNSNGSMNSNDGKSDSSYENIEAEKVTPRGAVGGSDRIYI